MNSRSRRRTVPLFTALLTGVGLAAAACGGGAAAPPVNAPPASPHTAAERAATLNWLAKTNQMWTRNDFAALDQVTTGEMRTVYQAQEQQKTTSTGGRHPLQLTGLSITIPCQSSGSPVFVAYGDTDVVTLGQSMQPIAMIFEQVGRAWKLAAIVQRPTGTSHWPALCRQGTAPTAPTALAPGRYAPDLAQVLDHAATGTPETAATAAPFAVNSFFSGPGSFTAQSATQIRQDRAGRVALTERFSPATDPTFALPLAGGRGYWLIGASPRPPPTAPPRVPGRTPSPTAPLSPPRGRPSYTTRPTPTSRPTRRSIRFTRRAERSPSTDSSAGRWPPLPPSAKTPPRTAHGQA
jgi:hypothetical protein